MINIGFLGAGDIAGVHAAAIEAVDGARLAAVADLITERAQMLANHYGAAALSGLDELLHYPGLDVVYILTPPEGHGQQIIAAAEAGLPIFCEKPLTVSLEEADEALAAVQAFGVPLMTGLSHRFHPLAARAKLLLEDGLLGDFVAAWSHRLIHLPVAPESWLNDVELGGGPTLQYAMHDLDWTCWLGGEVAQVTAEASQVDSALSIEDNLWALIQFRGGGSATVGVSWSVPDSWTERGLIGSQGNLRIVEQKRLVGCLTNDRCLDLDLGDDYDWFDVFVRVSSDIVDRLRRGLPFSVDGQDGRRALEISLAVREAAQKRQMIELPFSSGIYRRE